MKKMLSIMVTVLLVLALVPFALAEGEATRIKLTSESKIVYIGQTLALTLTGTPKDAALPAVTYTSSKEDIATVDQSGVVTGLKRGRTTIKAVSTTNEKVKASLNIDVRIPPEEITLSVKEPVVSTGKTITLKASFLPKKVDNKKVTWSISDEAIATVSSKGQVKGIAPGQVTVTATSQANASVSGAIAITVVQKAKEIEFQEKEVFITAGETLRLVLFEEVPVAAIQPVPIATEPLPTVDPTPTSAYVVAPANTTDQSATFKINNTKVATVDETGLITAVSGGSATITVTTLDGSKKRDTIKVTVLQPVTGVSLKKNEIRVGVGRYYTLQAVLEPAKATNKNMTWVSSDESIATVSGTGLKGKVTGVAWGDCTVTGTTEDGGYSVTATVHGGSYSSAIRVQKIQIRNGKPSLTLKNVSDETITEVRYEMLGFDAQEAPINMTTKGDSLLTLKGTYDYPLAPDEETEHGEFNFKNPSKYEGLAVLHFKVTGITTDSGYKYNIPEDSQKWYTYDIR